MGDEEVRCLLSVCCQKEKENAAQKRTTIICHGLHQIVSAFCLLKTHNFLFFPFSNPSFNPNISILLFFLWFKKNKKGKKNDIFCPSIDWSNQNIPSFFILSITTFDSLSFYIPIIGTLPLYYSHNYIWFAFFLHKQNLWRNLRCYILFVLWIITFSHGNGIWFQCKR